MPIIPVGGATPREVRNVNIVKRTMSFWTLAALAASVPSAELLWTAKSSAIACAEASLDGLSLDRVASVLLAEAVVPPKSAHSSTFFSGRAGEETADRESSLLAWQDRFGPIWTPASSDRAMLVSGWGPDAGPWPQGSLDSPTYEGAVWSSGEAMGARPIDYGPSPLIQAGLGN